MSKVEAFRAHQFDDLEQQHAASWLGMWVFLATEAMFFGGVFTCYFVYRYWYLQAFASASNHLNILGGSNTAVLICSSFTMALAVHSAQTERRKPLMIFLLLTIILGLVFLGIKFFEYYTKFEQPGDCLHRSFTFDLRFGRPAAMFPFSS
jgi:cytochrome c oxidase subunit 3